MKDKIKTGLASFGMSGMVFHAPLLHVHQGFELHNILERSKNLSSKKYPNAKILRDFEDLISDEETELIVVNTPDHTHYHYVKKALMAGKHVIVEKPFTKKYEQAIELIELAKSRKLMLSVFQNRRWDGDFLTAKKIIDDKFLGSLVEFESHFDRYRNYIQKGTWKEDPESGSTLYNLGSHLIDQAIVLFGMPEEVYADVRIMRTGGAVDDHFEIILNYKNLKATLKASYLVREKGPRFIVHGTEGSFLKWGIDPQEENLKKGFLPDADNWGEEPESEWGFLNTNLNGLHFDGQIETLSGNYLDYYTGIYDAIRESQPLPVDPVDSAQGIKIIEEAFRSNHEKRMISLK